MQTGSLDNPVTALAASAMAGDSAALSSLWMAHRRYAAAVILVYKPATADVDDILQDVAETLVRKVSTLSDPASFVPWLRVVAMNAARLAGRKHAASPVLTSLDAMPADLGEVSPSSELDRRGQVRTLGQAGPATAVSDAAADLLALASKLPDEYREPLLLKATRELSYRQIGAILNLPETTIETRIARGRRMLRELARASEQGLTLHAIKVGVSSPKRAAGATQISGLGAAGLADSFANLTSAGSARPAHRVS